MVDSLGKRAYNIVRADGLGSLFRRIPKFVYYRTVRPWLPRRKVKYNSYPVYADRLFDSFIGGQSGNRPGYESGIINSLRTWVSDGDDIVIVGGGWGVSAVAAAKLAGETGSVTVIEGAERGVKRVRQTAELNRVSDRITVKHGIVGKEISLRGEAGTADSISPSELPECDVLELDCEGSELGILEDMNISPRVVIVESHGMYDSPSSAVTQSLEGLGYAIVSESVADAQKHEVCIEDDVLVVTGVLE